MSKVMSERDIEYLKDNVNKILMYLHNDEGTGKKGLVAQVAQIQSKLDSFISTYETTQAIKKAKIGIIGTIGGVIGTAIVWIIEKLLNHN